jgi:hypothetical protein
VAVVVGEWMEEGVGADSERGEEERKRMRGRCIFRLFFSQKVHKGDGLGGYSSS